MPTYPLDDDGPSKRFSGIGPCLMRTRPQFMATGGGDVRAFMDNVQAVLLERIPGAAAVIYHLRKQLRDITEPPIMSPHQEPFPHRFGPCVLVFGVGVVNMDEFVVVGVPIRPDTCSERHSLNVVLKGGAKHLARLLSHTLTKHAPVQISTRRAVTHRTTNLIRWIDYK